MSSKPKFHVHRGDFVKVISGAHKNAEGKVLEVIPAKSQVIVEKVRMIKKHQKKTQDQPNGAIINREGPIHISNVKLIEKAKSDDKKSKKAA